MLNFFTRKKENQDHLLAEFGKKSKRAQFHSLKISDIHRETADCVSIAFEIPAGLHSEYRFLPGQYLTLRTQIQGEEIRRSYSLCSSPLDNELRVAVKKLEGGKFSTYANDVLKVGESIDVMTPEGNFTTEIKASQEKLYLMFAAGSGITPMMSLMKTILKQEENSNILLFYGNKSSNSIIFRDTLDDLKAQYLNRLEIHHVLSREDQGTDFLKGRIDEVKCRKFGESFFNPAKVDEVFICGPETMIREVDTTLQSMGLPKQKIHFELFTSPTAAAVEAVKDKVAKKSEEVLSDVTVILDGEETHFSISSKGNSILDAALDAGADVPFACKGAVCCTCRAKVIEGSAEMDMNYALEDDEVEAGFILTCQSHPTSSKLVVSFDE